MRATIGRTCLVVALALAARTTVTSAQQPAQGSWAGWARCEIGVQGPGYADRQTHTWTITGTAPVVEGAFHVYAGTWSVVGGGSLRRSQGTQILMAQWATNVPAMSAPIATFVRASDGRMFIQARHAQLRGTAAIQGFQQLTIDGRPQTPARIAAEAFEWAFPVVDVDPRSGTATGSSTPPVTGSVGLMQPAGSTGTASCTWQFGRGAAAPAPPPPVVAQAIPTPPVPGGAGTGAGGTAPAPASAATATVTPTRPVTTTTAPVLTVVPLGPALLTPTLQCSLRGPAIDYWRPPYISIGRVNIGVQPVNGATGYTVSRNDRGLLTPTPLPVSGRVFYFVHEPSFTAPLNHSAMYVYTITALYPDGCGSTTLDVSPPLPNAPRVTADTTAGGGRVRFRAHQQDPQGDYSGVFVTGPGLPPGGRIVPRTDPQGYAVDFTIDGVPAGSRTWVVTAFWDIPGGRVMDVSRGATVTVNVP